jgi:molybdopterin molybdotransferase
MLTPSEALVRILERIPAPERVESVSLSEAYGRCLAARALSDVELPPFEKSMMDGFAVSAASLADGIRRLRVAGEARAGVPFTGGLAQGTCVEIFTGAELPSGCDAVEMVEHVRREGEWVLFERPVKSGQNVSHRGEILRADQSVYEPRRRLTAADLSVLASIGGDPVPVFARPRVTILTTGDELVPPRERPGRGQIREGNTFFLRAACEALGCEVLRAGIVPDDARVLAAAFAQALEDSDVLITTGGVSVGKYDLVGTVLADLGVEPLLHKVAVKPGKPIWFGVRGCTPVFGLPGNPVSTLLGFEVFVRAALVRLCGDDPALERERIARGRWRGRTERGGDRQNNLPARTVPAADGVCELEPLPFRGSADIVAAAQADALAIVPAGGEIGTGELVEYRPLSA